MVSKYFVLTSFLFLFFFASHANERTNSQRLIDEFKQLRTAVSQLQPDNNVPGGTGHYENYFQEKDYGDYVIMWRLEEQENNPDYHEVIRLYIKPQGEQDSFAVTYHKTTQILKGTLVLRKFVGPEPIGWRNDTINYKTGEYLGFQGMRRLVIPKHIEWILTQWGINPLLF